MTIQLEEVGVDSEKITRPLPIVTSDSHMSPRGEDLKAYCPSRLRSAFEEWRRDEMQRRPYNTFQAHPGAKKRQELNAKTEGHFDIHARLRDMNADGVAAEVIFHGSQTPEPFPFGSTGAIDTRLEIADRNLALTGIQMYNRWLADACSVEPDRHVGLAYIPAWDIENTLSTMEWAKEAGLKGINFPAPRPYLAEYDNPVWDPVWAAAETMELPLVSHAGGIAPGVMDDGVHSDTPGNIALIGLEGGGWPSRRGLGRMLFAGVFERFPRLKMVYAEHPGLWWGPAMFEYDTQWHEVGPALQLVMPRKPSDYCRTNVFVGASFLSHFETEDAVHQNYWRQYMWGSDYPHREGTYAYPSSEDAPNRTRLALREAFHEVSPNAVIAMAGGTAIDVFGLNGDALAAIARRIDAPSTSALVAPLDSYEVGEFERIRDRTTDYSMAFRENERVAAVYSPGN